MEQNQDQPVAKPQNSNFWLEMAPIIVFALVWKFKDFFWATACLMLLTSITVVILWKKEGKLPVMPLFSLVVILIFGGLTLYLKDERFFKMKPSIYYAICSILLFIGLAFNKLFLKSLLGNAITLSDSKWRKLTINLALFFLLLIGANELIWRTQETGIWVAFKIVSAFLLTGFLVVQMIILKPEEFTQQSIKE